MTDTTNLPVHPAPQAGDTKRAYAVRLGLANPTRGRFGAPALAAISLAEAAGFVFAEPVVKVATPKAKADTPATPAAAPQQRVATPKPAGATASFNAKEVRAWAKASGVKVGERGRIHPSVIDAFVKAGGKPAAMTPKQKPTPLDMPQRKEKVGFVVERNTTFALVNCAQAGKGGCGKTVQACTCASGPVAPHYMDKGVAGTPLLMVKPVL